jgi:peptide/nickel transport system permease protein
MTQDFDSETEKLPAPGVPATELEMANFVGVDNELAEADLGPVPIRPVAAKTEFRIVARRFFKHKAARAGLIVMALIILLAFSSIGFGPIPGWWRYNYTDFEPTLTDGGAPTLSIFPPAWGDHPFGQSNEGRDYFALTMRGLQQSLIIAFIVGIVSTVIGTIIGAVSGYFRGATESILMRFTDVMITIPLLAVAAVISRQIGGSGVVGLGVLLGLVTWTTLARIVRGEFLSLREKEFVDAARSVGASSRRIIFRHILPNTIGVITVSATLAISGAILLETALSFLNFGVKSPDISLGLLLQQYRQAMDVRPYLFWWPGILIVVISLSINFIGDGLRDAFDPRQTRAKA